MKKYTQDEIEYIKDNYNKNKTIDEIALNLNRSRKAIINKAYELGISESLLKHGMCKRLNRTKFYKIFSGIKKRCQNVKDKEFKNYGGRGIKLCDKWKNFENFKLDMYNSYLVHVEIHGENNTSIERIDVNGDYCKENCKWITLQEQAGNTRKNKCFIAISPYQEKYKAKNISEFSKIHNLNQSHVASCLRGSRKTHKGWIFYYE